jgi:hypothetical protein
LADEGLRDDVEGFATSLPDAVPAYAIVVSNSATTAGSRMC